MHSYTVDCKKHENSKAHLTAYTQWKKFNSEGHEGVDMLFSRARRDAVERYNEEVRQNREMLKNIGEAVLYLAKKS